MAVRGGRFLIFGAGSREGRRLVEAFLALGAEVLAADRLRTELEELRAGLRQHERLQVAECDPRERGAAAALFGDACRDQALDAAILALPAQPAEDAWRSDARAVEACLDALPACVWFVRGGLEQMARHAKGRLVVVAEPGPGRLHADRTALVARLVTQADAEGRRLGIPVLGLELASSAEGALARAIELCDPERPAEHAWLSPR